MKVLNPHFDTVFKFLMEDLEIVKGLVEAIIKQEVLEIYPAPQESTSFDLKVKYNQLPIHRQDFVAIIKTKTQSGKFTDDKVIIEVQKSYIVPAIGRFRNYISEKYGKKSIIGDEQKYLPIKTIYLIEETFNKNLPPVLGRKGVYYDELEEKPFQGERDEMVELFNHDSWFIQTKLLPKNFKDELMYVLSVFAPWFKDSESDRFIIIPDDNIMFQKQKLLIRILRRLEAATKSESLNRNLDMEIDYENYMDNLIETTEKAIKEKEQAKLQNEINLLFYKNKLKTDEIAKKLKIAEELVKKLLS